MAKDINYLFYVYIKNGKMFHYRPKAWNAFLLQNEGKDLELSAQKRHEPKTIPQLAYYFGGIIRGTLMKTTDFAGWEFERIDNYLRSSVRTETAVIIDKNGKEKTVSFVNADIEKFDVDNMSQFINDILDFLAIEHEIRPLSPDNYLYRKYLVRKI